MNAVIERTIQGPIREARLYLVPTELMLITTALYAFSQDEKRNIQDRAKAELMRSEIHRALSGDPE